MPCPFDHCNDAALFIKGSNASKRALQSWVKAKFSPQAIGTHLMNTFCIVLRKASISIPQRVFEPNPQLAAPPVRLAKAIGFAPTKGTDRPIRHQAHGVLARKEGRQIVGRTILILAVAAKNKDQLQARVTEQIIGQ